MLQRWKITLRCPKRSHSTPSVHYLHWSATITGTERERERERERGEREREEEEEEEEEERSGIAYI
jgi:hypothetical protein